MSRITDFRIDYVSMPSAEYWAMPLSVRALIEAYSEKLREQNGRVTFELAIYRWDEIKTLLHQIESGECRDSKGRK